MVAAGYASLPKPRAVQHVPWGGIRKNGRTAIEFLKQRGSSERKKRPGLLLSEGQALACPGESGCIFRATTGRMCHLQTRTLCSPYYLEQAKSSVVPDCHVQNIGGFHTKARGGLIRCLMFYLKALAVKQSPPKNTPKPRRRRSVVPHGEELQDNSDGAMASGTAVIEGKINNGR